MMRDIVVLSLVVAAFACLLTAHLLIVVGLVDRRPRWRALVALFAAPLAPWWAFRERWPWRGAAWLAAAVAYGASLCLALR
jgi:hypothetical protein